MFYTEVDARYVEDWAARRRTQAAQPSLGPAYEYMAELCAPVEFAGLEKAGDPLEQDRIWALLCESAQS